MKRKVLLVLGVCMLAALVAPALAADDAPQTYVYATYHKCDLARQDRADELTKTAFAPIYDAAVADKKILSWGWIAHNTGGEWRRVDYYVAPGLDNLLAAGKAIGEKLEKDAALADHEFRTICYAHDDYIWRLVAASAPATDVARKRSADSFSTYFVCDSAKEARADEIVKETMAPLWDAQIKAGNINSWSWFEHIVGGKYRRLAVVDGPSFEKILAARGAVIQAMSEKQKDAMKEFDEICGSHQDYMWEVRLPAP